MNTATTSIVKINLSAAEAAQALGISARTLWTYTRAGTIPSLKIGSRTLFPTTLLEDWVIAHATRGAAKPTE